MNSSLVSNLKFLMRFGIWSELSNFFRILSELLIGVLWLISLSEDQLHWVESFLVLALIFIGSYILARLLHHLKWKIWIQRVIFTAWIVFSLSLSANRLLFSNISLSPREFFAQIFIANLSPQTNFGFWILLFSLVMLLRGVQVARYPVTSREMTAGLRFNLILFAAYALIFAREQPGIFLPTFFAFILLTLASLSLARITDLSDSYGGRLPGFNLQWAVGIGLAAMLVVVLGIITSWVINLDVAQFLGRGLTVILQLIFGAIVLITSPILLAIVSIIQFLLKLLAPNLENFLNETELDAGSQLLEDFSNQITEATRTDPRLFIMIAVLLLFVVVAIMQLRWKPWQRLTRGEEGTSNIDANFRFSNPLRNIFQNRGRRKRRRSARSLIAAARVRYTYAQLMDLCEKLGKPRPRSLTPNEFLPKMANLFPLNKDDLVTITEAYVKIRYGELPETSKDIEDVLEAWKRISLFGKEILDERTKNLRRAAR